VVLVKILMRVATPLLLLALLPGCNRVRDAHGAAAAMRSAACAGDVVAFFARVDRTRLTRHLQAAAMETVVPKVARDLAFTNMTSSKLCRAGSLNQQHSLDQRPATPDGMEDDIKKGKAGGLCAVSFLSDWTKDSTGEVWVRYRTGYEWVWVFTRFGDSTWMLTDLVPAEKRR